MSAVCPQCRGVGIYYVGVAARFAVRCECSVEKRRRETLLAGGFDAAAADLTAADAVRDSGRNPAAVEQYRLVATKLAAPAPGDDRLRFMTLPFYEISPEPLANYFAAAHALLRPVKKIAMGLFIEARFGRTAPPTLTTETAAFLMLGNDARHSYLPSETATWLETRRRAPAAFTVVVCVAGWSEIVRLYGNAVAKMLTENSVL
jgi:hypothetical protein